MKKTLLVLSFSFAFLCYSQEEGKSLYLKGNALLAPLGVLNAGLEYQLNSKYTLQGDLLISPWKSFAGAHAQIYMGHLEGRYYFHEAFRKWYVGVNAGAGVFDLTKWTYVGTELYQRGFNYMVGAAVGYQFVWKERWNVDVFLGGGNVQSFYHGYDKEGPNSIRYDDTSTWNKSGEWIPYRGGIMLSYKLK